VGASPHHDGLGSVRALTDETGTTVDTRAYEAFGTKNVEAGNDPLTYGFAGEPFEPTSLLAYHRARWMDARVGRFVGMDRYQGDPQHPLTHHAYLYASADPPNHIDPSGLDDIGSVDLVSISFGSLDATPVFGSNLFGGFVVASLLNPLDQEAIRVLTPLIPISVQQGREYGGLITLNPDYTYSTIPAPPVAAGNINITVDLMSTYAAVYHTHGSCTTFPSIDNNIENFSPQDEFFAQQLGIPSYLGTPSGAIKKYQSPVSKIALAGKSVGVTTLVLGNGTCPVGGSLE
jgi:RHS repeat-associated protein